MRSTGTATATQTDPSAQFFDDLGRRGHEPLLRTMTVTLRFDLASGQRTEHWLVTVTRGDIAVSRGTGRADAIVGVDKQLFDEIVRSDANFMASLARGAITVEGDVRPLVRFQRLFPGPTPERKSS